MKGYPGGEEALGFGEGEVGGVEGCGGFVGADCGDGGRRHGSCWGGWGRTKLPTCHAGLGRIVAGRARPAASIVAWADTQSPSALVRLPERYASICLETYGVPR